MRQSDTVREQLALEQERDREEARKRRERLHQQELRTMESMYVSYEQYRQYPYNNPELQLYNRLMKIFADRADAEANAHGAAALARAQEQLSAAPDLPDDIRAVLLHGGIDPQGKFSELDMGFADRFTRIRAAANTASPVMQAFLDSVSEKMQETASPLSRIRGEITTISRLQREHSRASRLCKSKEGARLLLQESHSLEDCDAVQEYDAFLTSMEELVGLKSPSSLPQKWDTLHRKLDVVVPQQLRQPHSFQRNPEFTVEFQNLDNVFRQMAFSDPKNWESPHGEVDFPADKAAFTGLQTYLRATGLRTMDVLFGEVESLPSPMSRADLVIIEGRTLREMLNDNAEVQKLMADRKLPQLTPEIIRMKGAEMVSTALLSGRKVEVWAPEVENGSVKLLWEPTPLKATGYRMQPRNPNLSRLWQDVCRQAGMPPERAVNPEEQRLRQAQARERARNAVQLYFPNLQMELPKGYHDPDALRRQQECQALSQQHARSYVKRVTAMAAGDGDWQTLHFSLFNGMEPEPGAVGFTLGRLAALTLNKGYNLEEMLSSDSLAAERQRLGEEYGSYLTTRSANWYAENLLAGTEALLTLLERETAKLNLTQLQQVLEKLPRLNVVGKALAQLSSRMQDPDLRQRMISLCGEEKCRELEESMAQVSGFFAAGQELLEAENRQYEAWQSAGEFDTRKLEQQRENFRLLCGRMNGNRLRGEHLFTRLQPEPEPVPEVEPEQTLDAPEPEKKGLGSKLKTHRGLFGRKS